MKPFCNFCTFIIVLLFNFSFVDVFAQKIFYTTFKSEAQATIYITKNRYEANWIIFNTKWSNEAKKGIWYEVSFKNDADLILYITSHRYEADKLVFYTKYHNYVRFEYPKNGKLN